jgi:SpoVK/Ycf46/Vps4 family AAA+-type ATPase
LPNESEISKIVNEEMARWKLENKKAELAVDDEALKMLIRNFNGLTSTEAARLARKAMVDHAITHDDVAEATKAKYELLNKGGVLFFEPDTAQFSDVGGLKKLKFWLEQRRPLFVGDQRIPGLTIPKGILLLGVQGSGKSLAAKAVAGTWRVPLLRLDYGALYDKYYGETERKTRESLKMAELMSPCVLWIDEIEKGVATGDGDGGTSRRVLGTLLTWMAERKSAVFLVATANDIQSLPPELLRKGRLDEIFFVDLPDAETRIEILSIHLKKRGLDPASFDLPKIAEACDGFSGAEIEQAIVSALYSIIGGAGHLDSAELLKEIRTTRPLSVVMAEQINAMREWARERTVSAN